jgi:hypothetical protein
MAKVCGMVSEAVVASVAASIMGTETGTESMVVCKKWQAGCLSQPGPLRQSLVDLVDSADLTGLADLVADLVADLCAECAATGTGTGCARGQVSLLRHPRA